MPEKYVNYHNVINNIGCPDEYNCQTIWHNIKMLLPGSSLKIYQGSSQIQLEFLDEVGDLSFPGHEPADPMDILVNEVRNRAREIGATAIAVSFSGGCDSTGLLVAAKSAFRNDNISAVTWTFDHGSAHEDLIAAKELTSKLGVRHIIQDIDPRYIFEPPMRSELTPNVSTSIAFHQFRKWLGKIVVERIGRNVLLLNGHGGDHIYMDPVPFEVIDDAYRQGGLRSAYHIAKVLSSLHGENIYRFWISRRRGEKNRLMELQLLMTPMALEMLTNEKARKTAKEAHRNMVKQAIYQNAVVPDDASLVQYHPYTSSGIVSSVWNLPAKRFYNAVEKRIPFRNSFDRFCNNQISLRANKGHITGAFQRALKLKQNRVIELVGDGCLERHGLIYADRVIAQISKVAMGYGGFNGFLLKIICFELMMNSR